MKTIKRYEQYRRDFNADMECEKCSHVQTRVSCYDDAHFHNNVIPDMICKQCNQSTNSLGLKQAEAVTKYPEHLTV